MKRLIFILLSLALLPSLATAAVTVSVTQSGADSGSVMAGKTFTVTASGWSGNCNSAYLDLTNCGVCSVSESQSKSISGSSISWTTLTATKANSQSVTVSISGTCTPDSGSASFDVKNPPSLSATVSPSSSSVTQGSSFPISLSIQNTGETTARFGTITASPSYFSPSGCSLSDIPGGQSLGVSCSMAASGSATTGAQTLTLGINPTNTDSITKTVSVTVDAAPGSPGGSSSSGGGGGGGSDKEKKVAHKINPPGLVNNTKLQAALEKVLAKGRLDQSAVDNLVRLSNIISGQNDVSRTISTGTSKSNVTTKIKYNGAKIAKNYVVYEKLPKSFANSSDLITVSVSGAKVEIVEKDPEYAILFDTVSPNQELTIFYSVSKAVSTGAVDSFATEVYAESLEEPIPACAQVITPARNPATGECKEFPTPCDVPAGWENVDSCAAAGTTPAQNATGEQKEQNGMQKTLVSSLLVILITLLVIVAGSRFIKKKREERQAVY